MPRLAVLKLQGASSVADSVKGAANAKNMLLTLASAVMIAGASIAAAAWIGGSLVDAREAFAQGADQVAVSAGFEAKTVLVGGVAGARAAEVRASALPAGRESLFSASPEAVRARIEQLPWVEEAKVVRLWPSTVRIDVKRREAYALWQAGGAVRVIDADGAPVAARPADFAGLPLVVGQGAAPAARPILEALENAPALRTRTAALIRVGERRWNLKMKNGMVVALPEREPLAALDLLNDLQTIHRLLDRPLARVDLREPGRLIVLPKQVLAGGPGLSETDALLEGA